MVIAQNPWAGENRTAVILPDNGKAEKRQPIGLLSRQATDRCRPRGTPPSVHRWRDARARTGLWINAEPSFGLALHARRVEVRIDDGRAITAVIAVMLVDAAVLIDRRRELPRVVVLLERRLAIDGSRHVAEGAVKLPGGRAIDPLRLPSVVVKALSVRLGEECLRKHAIP